jgi:hypothetical protein
MRFVCTHSVAPGSISSDQLRQMAQAAQNDPKIRGVRSYCNLSQGKAVCVMDSPDQQTLANWFRKMNLPFDSINVVEYEGDGGNIKEITSRQPAQV